ncbi:STAS domain-containing protein [Chloroflexus sp.]|uniref:STAS domain-containing protein n=1 Tax=Chloroflexus sp. TaxID=1904827 RepID=UPI002589F379|nr:STAS domain-containing protein [Chloroflexus sp.]
MNSSIIIAGQSIEQSYLHFITDMTDIFHKLLDIRHSDEESRQRGRNIVIIALGLLVINLIVSITIIVGFTELFSLLVATFLAVLLYAVIVFLTRRGSINLGGWLTVGTALFGTTVASFVNPDRPVTVFLAVSLVLAATLLRFRDVIVVFGLVLLALGSLALFAESTVITVTSEQFLIPSAILCGFITVISFVQSFGNEVLHRRLQTALQQTQQSAHELKRLNAELDRRVTLQTETLHMALQELEERSRQQDKLLAEVIAQRDVIRQLSVPVLPVGPATLVMPLIGTIDRDRLTTIQQQALTAIGQQHARWLILDVTGVPVIDTEVAGGLIQLVQSVRLLGADVVLVGVRPEVAQTMVSLSIELPITHVYSDLASAIESVAHRAVNARR